MRRCCILGGAGFIGSHLAARLIGLGMDVTSFGRAGSRTGEVQGVRHVDGEFSDTAAVTRAVEGCDVVFHLFGSTPARAESDRIGDLHNGVENSLKLMDAGVSGAFGKLVFVSSGGTVYGIPDQVPIPENAAQWPTCSYGVTKLTIERYLYVYHRLHGLRYAVGRPSNPFGPHQRWGTGQGIVAALMHCALTETPFVLVGDGSVVRDYIYVDDLAHGLIKLADYDGPDPVFNLGSGTGVSVNALIAMVEQATGRTIERVYRSARSIDVPINVLDVSRAEALLGWSAHTGLPYALGATFEWASAHSA